VQGHPLRLRSSSTRSHAPQARPPAPPSPPGPAPLPQPLMWQPPLQQGCPKTNVCCRRRRHHRRNCRSHAPYMQALPRLAAAMPPCRLRASAPPRAHTWHGRSRSCTQTPRCCCWSWGLQRRAARAAGWVAPGEMCGGRQQEQETGRGSAVLPCMHTGWHPGLCLACRWPLRLCPHGPHQAHAAGSAACAAHAASSPAPGACCCPFICTALPCLPPAPRACRCPLCPLIQISLLCSSVPPLQLRHPPQLQAPRLPWHLPRLLHIRAQLPGVCVYVCVCVHISMCVCAAMRPLCSLALHLWNPVAPVLSACEAGLFARPRGCTPQNPREGPKTPLRLRGCGCPREGACIWTGLLHAPAWQFSIQAVAQAVGGGSHPSSGQSPRQWALLRHSPRQWEGRQGG